MKLLAVRTLDPAFLNEVANHPEVRPALGGGDGPLDLSPVVTDPQNFALQYAHGGFLLQPLEPGSYELHTLFTPEQRGARFFAAAWDMLRYMFTSTDCLEIVTKCPDDNPGARMAALKVGFRERFHREDAWKPGVGISYQALSIDGWAARDQGALERGRRFHAELDAARRKKGAKSEAHKDDVAHDYAAGAACLMMECDRAQKAVGFYNRWTRVAGYQTIEMIAPNVVDIRDAVLGLQQGQVGVLLVR